MNNDYTWVTLSCNIETSPDVHVYTSNKDEHKILQCISKYSNHCFSHWSSFYKLVVRHRISYYHSCRMACRLEKVTPFIRSFIITCSYNLYVIAVISGKWIQYEVFSVYSLLLHHDNREINRWRVSQVCFREHCRL